MEKRIWFFEDFAIKMGFKYHSTVEYISVKKYTKGKFCMCFQAHSEIAWIEDIQTEQELITGFLTKLDKFEADISDLFNNGKRDLVLNINTPLISEIHIHTLFLSKGKRLKKITEIRNLIQEELTKAISSIKI